MRERFEQDAANDAEDRGVGADPERQGENRDEREGRVVAEGSDGILQIGADALDPGKPALGANGFRSLGEPPRCQQSLTARLGGVHSAPDVLGDLHFEVGFELFPEFAFLVIPGEDPEQSSEQRAKHSHEVSLRGLRKAAIRSAVRYQSLVSLASCFRPAAVRA